MTPDQRQKLDLAVAKLDRAHDLERELRYVPIEARTDIYARIGELRSDSRRLAKEAHSAPEA